MDITGGDYWIVRNNRFHDNASNRGDSDNSTKGSGIIIKQHAENNIVENNEIYNLNTAFGGITIGGSGAVETTPQQEAVNAIVRNNKFYNIKGPYVVLFQDAHNCKFTNNIVENCDLTEGIIRIRATRDTPIFKNMNIEITDNHFFGNKVSKGIRYIFTKRATRALKSIVMPSIQTRNTAI